MLLEALDEVKEKTYKKLNEWLKDKFANDLNYFAIEAIKLKEDYERALFVRLGYQSFNRNWKNSIDGMAALEMLDSSLLIADDIIDDAPRRMGKKTIHRAWGIENAIMLANILKSTSVLALVQSARDNSLNHAEFFALMQLMETNYSEMYLGEYLDLHYEKFSFKDVSIDDYLEMIKRTTGLHFGMAIKIGGLLAHGEETDLGILWDIGVKAGMILQIRDDFIDYLDREDVTHKPAFGDFMRKKKRLPLILAYQFFPKKIEELQNAPLEKSAIKELQSIISHKKIIEKSVEIVESIYPDVDYLIAKIKSVKVRKILSEFFNLIRRI